MIRSEVPRPLESGSFRTGSAHRGLPASLLSFGSLAAFVTTFGIAGAHLAFGWQYRLPLGSGSALPLGMAMTSLAVLVVVRARSRPGRYWPRLWAVTLAALSAGITLIALFHALADSVVPSSLVHAAVAAQTAAVFALAPRLLRIPPDSALTPHIAPAAWSVAALIIIALLVPFAGSVPIQEPDAASPAAAQLIARMEQASELLEAAAAFDWGRLQTDSVAAAEMAESLAAVGTLASTATGDPWRLAEIGGQTVALSAAAERLTTALASGLDLERTPRTAMVTAAPASRPTTKSPWTENPDMRDRTRAVASYWRAVGNLMHGLGDLHTQAAPAPTKAALRRADEAYRASRRRLDATWSDGWIGDLIDDTRSSIPERLRKLTRGAAFLLEGNAYDLAHVDEMLDIKRGRVERALDGGLTGCRLGGNSSHEWLACPAYALAANRDGADFMAELRVVYPRGGTLPAEVYLWLPVPAGQEVESFANALLASLIRAVKATGDADVHRTNPLQYSRGTHRVEFSKIDRDAYIPGRESVRTYAKRR